MGQGGRRCLVSAEVGDTEGRLLSPLGEIYDGKTYLF